LNQSNPFTYNKFDACDDPDFSYFRSKLEVFRKKDIKQQVNEVYKSLKVDATPFYPKTVQEVTKDLFNKVDINNIKEFYPKNYKVVKKEN